MLKNSFYVSVLVAGCVASTALYAQQCDSSKPSVTPDSRYQLLNNGKEVKDLKTGLIWQRCLAGENWDGQKCTGEKVLFDSSEVKQYLATRAQGWRLPSIDELVTLKSGCWQPAINTRIFPPNTEHYDTHDTLLSSTPHTLSKREADVLAGQNGYQKSTTPWFRTFETGYGQIGYEMIQLPVRLVRK